MEIFLLIFVIVVLAEYTPAVMLMISNAWNNYLAHKEKIAQIEALKNLKQLPQKEEVPSDLIEAWREVNNL